MADPVAGAPQDFGRFRLNEVLGKGGYGVVFRAFDPRLNRDVALKLPRPDCLWTPELRQRFLFEGHAAAVLDHPNVVPVYEVGEIDDVCYLAAAYCPGRTLAQWLRERTTPVPVADAARLVAALADGVDHAHRRGVLHRDLKPGNVLLGEHDTPRVTDFGLARLSDGSGGDQTRTGEVLGTPGYMAPEQALGDHRRVGTHTDVYALGVILYELLTGARPFADSDRAETLRLVVVADIPPPRRDGKRLPRDLESVCLKCLEKDPARRYPTAGELATDLRRFLAGEPVLARPVGTWTRAVKWCRRRPATAGFAAASLVSLVLLGAAVGWHSYEVGRTNDALRAALGEAERQEAEAERQRDLARRRAEETRSVAYAGQVRLAADLWQSGQFGLAGELLDGLVPQPGETDHREFSWWFLRNQSRNNHWLTRHEGAVRSIAFDPVRQTLYSVSDDGSIRGWDPSTGRERRKVADTGPGRPRSLAVSPDGLRLAVASDANATGYWPETKEGERLIRVWDAETGVSGGSLSYRGFPKPDLLFLDEENLAVSRVTGTDPAPGAVLLWNPKTGTRRRLLADQHLCTALAVSPDGRTLAAACEARPGDGRSAVHLLSLPGGEVVGRLPAVKGELKSLAFSPDGASLVGAGPDEPAVLWDVATRSERWRAVRADQDTHSIAFAEHGRQVVSLSVPKDPAFTYLRVRDVETGAEIRPATQMTGDAAELALDPLAGWFALPRHNIVQLARLKPLPPVERLAGHTAEIWGVAFTPDGRSVLTSSDDATVAVWDLATRTRRHTLRGHPSLAGCVAVSPVGNWAVSGDYDGGLIVWDLETGHRVRGWKGHGRFVRGVAVSPDGLRIASGGRDHTTRLWDARTGEQLAAWNDHSDMDVRAVAFTPDGRRLVSAGLDKSLVVRDLATGEVVRLHDRYPIAAMGLTPDGRHALTGAGDGVPHVWDLTTGKVRTLSGGHGTSIEGIAVTPDGRTVATTGFAGTVRLWHLPTGSEIGSLGTLSSRAAGVAFSPDGNTLAAVFFDGSVLTWSTGAPTAR